MKRPGTPHRAGQSREGDSHHLGSHHLGAVSGAFPVNQRGRRWFIWRSLRAGRRMRRPEKAGRRGQSSFRRGQWRRGQSSFGPGVLRRRSDRWDPESAEFCSRSPILMVARRNGPMTPRHALPREGGREGDSHHLDEESCDGCQPRWDPAQAEGREGDSHHLDQESCDGCQTGKGSRICRFLQQITDSHGRADETKRRP